MILVSIFVLVISSLIIGMPLMTPVTDDWIFYPWQTRQVSPGNFSDLELFVGQQQILMKYFLYLSSYIPFLSAPRTGILNLLFGTLGIILILKSQFRYLGKIASPTLATALVVVCFSFKPLYMYFMATSLGSMLALFLIGIYLFVKNFIGSKSLVLLPVLFLSPFTFGTGLIVVVCELIERIYVLIKSKKVSLNSKDFIFFAVIFLSIFLSQILPNMTKNYNYLVGGAPAPLTRGVIEVFSDPINTVKFLIISMGNIFVPSSRFDPGAPLIAGLLFVLATILFSKKINYLNVLDGVLTNRSCLLAGIIYILLTLVARGVPSEQGYASATAPRYICGTFLFTVGILVILSKYSNNKTHLKFFYSLVIFAVLFSGVKTGIEWLSVRRSQTIELTHCLNSSSPKDLEAGGRCFILAQVVRNPVNDEIFSEQLRNFKSKGY